MESMPTLVQQSLQVIMDTHGIHEDEGPLNHREFNTVAAGGFVFTIFQVEQIFFDHQIKIGSQFRVNLVKHARDPSLQFIYGLERPQRRATGRVHIQIPGPQAIHA